MVLHILLQGSSVFAPSAFKTRRLGNYNHAVDQQYWNAASAHHRDVGWITFAHRTHKFWGHSYEDMDGLESARPVVTYLGQHSQPIAQIFHNWTEVAFDSTHMESALNKSAGDHFLIMDLRPFVWQHRVYVSHSLRIVQQAFESWVGATEQIAISEFDYEQNTLMLRHIFPEDMLGGGPRTEKNWGFFRKDSQMMFVYSVFPCMQYGVFDLDAHTHVLNKFECYDHMEGKMADMAGFAIADCRTSAHPVMWHNPQGLQEYLIMVHTRTVDGYDHWLVRADANTLKPTHLSKGAVFGARFFAAEGFVQGAIIVGSIHVYGVHHDPQLYIFGGEGDAYCIIHSLKLRTVMWLDIETSPIT
ncbi:TPA: hypothetical protein ACH3X3_009504 [Trebouxia sp. C0006]